MEKEKFKLKIEGNSEMEFESCEDAVTGFVSFCENLMDKKIRISLERVGKNGGEKRP